MARKDGQPARFLIPGLLALVVLAPLAVFYPIFSALGLAALSGAVAWLTSIRARTLGKRCDKLSGEVDVLSERLLRLETQAGADRLKADTMRSAGSEAISAGVEEVTVEIGLLSGIVRDLAAVVANQDGEIAKLKEAPAPVVTAPPVLVAPVSKPVVTALPSPEPVPEKPARDMPIRSIPPVPMRRPDPGAFAGSEDASSARTLGPDQETAIVAAFDGDGIEVHLQPIVTLPQRKVFSYEASARLRVDGVVLASASFMPVLERHGRTTDLDRRMLQRVATIARHLAGRGSEAGVSYGLSPLSLFEPGFLRSLRRIVTEPALAGRLVLALPQASWLSLDAEQAAALAALRERIGFILDRPGDLRFDVSALKERGVSQVKVPAEMLLGAASGRRGLSDIAVEDIAAALSRAGIQLVADAVEREADVPDLIDLDVPFAQGGVFAAPRAVRAEVLASAPAGPIAPVGPEQEPEPPTPRRSFRDFLRRAG